MTRAFLVGVLSAVAIVTASRGAEAMPVFAEALGMDCSKCHIQVPALNSYGRYVQRSMYAVLDRRALAATVPVWVGEQANYDTMAPFEPHHVQFGSLAIHASGYIADNVTTHVQQWLTQNDQPGGLDTAWVSYDRIFGPNTHLVVGKQPAPGPSLFAQWMDLAPFAVPSTAVGEHVQEFSDNRWGSKAGWTNPYFSADVGWFGSEADLNGATDFSNDTDKAIQWNVAYAPFDRPIQVGIYGSHGTAPLGEDGIDRYAGSGAYFQLDRTAHAPGVLLLHQQGWDGNPGVGEACRPLGRAISSGTSLELFFKPLRHYEGLVSVREELTSDGLGNVIHTSNADVNVRLARFVHATLEGYTQSLGKPGLRYRVWWTTPIEKAH